MSIFARYILDHRDEFREMTILDVGSGCGASAIAARMAGADHVIANDICPGMIIYRITFFFNKKNTILYIFWGAIE